MEEDTKHLPLPVSHLLGLSEAPGVGSGLLTVHSSAGRASVPPDIGVKQTGPSVVL